MTSLLPEKAKVKAEDSDSRYIKNVRLLGHEKRYKPSKHYVYILKVKWSDRTEYVIYRSYSMFFQFHTKILDMFPIEAGVIDSKDRVIPPLPGRRMFRRSEIQKVAEKRLASLGEYCQTMIKLDTRISRNSLFLDFFTATMEDINPPVEARTKPERNSLLSALLPFKRKKDKRDRISVVESLEPFAISNPMLLEPYKAIATYKSTEKTEISFEEGAVVEVVEKHETGWWFVQVEDHEGLKQGWAPASYLDPLNYSHEESEPEPNYKGEKYVSTHAYEAVADDEISFEKGLVLDVYHRLLDGWWIAGYNGNVGHVPATFLTPYTNPHLISKSSVKSKRSLSVSLSVRDPTVPTPRRCSIKSTKSISLKKRDLEIYRNLSFKSRRESGSEGSYQEQIGKRQPLEDLTATNEAQADSYYENDSSKVMDEYRTDEPDTAKDNSNEASDWDYENMSEFYKPDEGNSRVSSELRKSPAKSDSCIPAIILTEATPEKTGNGKQNNVQQLVGKFTSEEQTPCKLFSKELLRKSPQGQNSSHSEQCPDVLTQSQYANRNVSGLRSSNEVTGSGSNFSPRTMSNVPEEKVTEPMTAETTSWCEAEANNNSPKTVSQLREELKAKLNKKN